jgi:hypothetical protein
METKANGREDTENWSAGRAGNRGPGDRRAAGTRIGRAIRFTLLLVLASLIPVGAVMADSRAERPLQVQLDLSGASVGYHFSELVFVGYTQQGRVKTRDFGCFGCEDDEDVRIYDQNRVDDADFSFGVRRSLEVRFSPWKFGFYFSLGILSVEQDEQRILYKEGPRVVGENAYNDSGLLLQVRAKRYEGLAGGMGINHVFESGLSLGAGFLMGLTPEETPEVTATSFGSDPASQEDLAIFKREVEDEYLEFPPVGMFHLAVGYNF